MFFFYSYKIETLSILIVPFNCFFFKYNPQNEKNSFGHDLNFFFFQKRLTSIFFRGQVGGWGGGGQEGRKGKGEIFFFRIQVLWFVQNMIK